MTEPHVRNERVHHDEISEDSSSEVCVPKCRKMIFNVGGTKFQTLRETLNGCESTRLSDELFLNTHYDTDGCEYFFDKDPEMFRSVLNYVRSGKLHLPATLCGPMIKEEMEFWGLSEIDIEPCCWAVYNNWTSTVNALEQLEKDRKQNVQHVFDDSAPWYTKVKVNAWIFLTSHNSSIPAQIYGWLSLLFVMVAIFSFCAATHPIFKVPSMRRGANVTSGNATENKTTDIESLEEDTERHPVLFYIDIVCLTFFTAEYVLRFICAPKKFKFLLSPLSIIDLLAILPDYIEFLIYAADPEAVGETTFMHFMPLLRLMRAFRIFRLIRHVPGLWIMFYTLKASYKDLSLMLVFLLVGMLLFSSLIFFADDNKVFTSIPHGFWWAVVTMTTVGYGDMYPTSRLGYLVGSITAICGVLLIGFTIPALVNNFSLYYQHVEFAMQKEKLMKEQKKNVMKEKSNHKPPSTNHNHYRDPGIFQEHLPLYSQVGNGSKCDRK
ncbi:potassium voltage-gated channel protein Shaw-like [Haliotis cracherodii]|uniref:potassium voltage-gated channel protein Shaw-like n=1 Tax=Haliotis cracherodii TaxID=6455 RepID=UPI0039EC877D